MQIKSLTIIESFDSATNDQLNQFEDQFAIELPCDFKLFLSTQNVYVVEENCFLKDRSSYEVHHFYPLHDKSEMSLFIIFEALGEYFENSYIPFADDSGGWQYLISVRKEDYGKVYFCRMDEELRDGLTLLANNFTEFINGLKKETPLV